MMAARVFLGASLFVLLIMAVCSLPLDKGSTKTVVDVASNQKGALVYPFPGAVPSHAPHGVVSVQEQPNSPQHVQREPAGRYYAGSPQAGASGQPGTVSSYAHYGVAPVQQANLPAVYAGSHLSGHGQSGYTDSTQTGGAVQPEQAINWAVEPPKLGEETSNTQGLASSTTDEQSQVLVPAYHPGELSHFEKAAEAGDYQSETEELGRRTVPSTVGSGLVYPGFATRPFVMGGLWGRPYPYFDYMFMTGQYPPGTVSHFSQNYEQGRDYAHSTRYLKDQAFLYPGVNQQAAAIQAAHGNRHPSWHTRLHHVAGSHGQGGTHTMPASSHRDVTQTRYQVNPTA